jgi:hypothetical protein
MRQTLLPLAAATLAAATAPLLPARSAPERLASPLIGRWDLTVHAKDGDYPSWLGVDLSGTKTLVGAFVSRGGSARPISEVHFENGKFNFTIPKQWEAGPKDLAIEGELSSGKLTGRIQDPNGNWTAYTGVRAPELPANPKPVWGKSVELFNGKDLSGWKPRRPNAPNGWVVHDGLLQNKNPGNDLITERKFQDFKLHAEFLYPKGSNSGIYLRGRYEAQIEDDYGLPADSHYLGGIYGFVSPRVNAAKPAGEWQTMDITLVGREVSITVNGEPVVTRQVIPGVTGGALDSREGEEGPIFLQGDHGPVEFRKVTLTPAR